MLSRYSKLSFFYFFYFAGLGIYLPYWAPYLKTLGFNAADIGILLAVVLSTRVFAPYLWGWLADHRNSRLKIVRLGSMIAVLSFSMVLFNDSFWWLFVMLFLFGFFWNAILPQVEVITLDSLGHASHYYSTIRLWGSVGFILASAGIAFLVDQFGIKTMPWFLVLVLLILMLVTMKVIERRRPAVVKVPIKTYLFRPEVLALLLSCFLMQISHGPYYTFFSIYMQDYGYGNIAIGSLWSLGVIAEIVLFIYMYRLLSTFGAPLLLGVSVAVTALRWLLIAFFPNFLPLLITAQILHAITFGLYHAAMIYLIAFWFPGSVRGRGQALAGASFGFGGAIGAYSAGYLWNNIGGEMVFIWASVVGLVALPLTWVIYRGICRTSD